MGKGHSDVIFISGFNYIVIPNRTTGLGNIFNTALMRPLYIISKWEESIRTQGNPSNSL